MILFSIQASVLKWCARTWRTLLPDGFFQMAPIFLNMLSPGDPGRLDVIDCVAFHSTSSYGEILLSISLQTTVELGFECFRM